MASTASQRRRVDIKTAPAAKKAPAKKVVVNMDTHKQEEVEIEPEIQAHIPTPFTLTLDDYKEIKYKAGVHPMPKSHFDHWYTQLMGVQNSADVVAKTA